MKCLLVLFFFFFFTNFGSAQNVYKTYSEEEKKEIISLIDNDTLLSSKSISDTIVNENLTLKFNLIGFCKKAKYVKINFIVGSKSDAVSETYYFDEQGYLIYCKIEKFRFNHLINVLEVNYYNKDKIIFLIDGIITPFHIDEIETMLTTINIDLKTYKEYLKQ